VYRFTQDTIGRDDQRTRLRSILRRLEPNTARFDAIISRNCLEN
jgi:hypothetical protein